MEQRVRMMAEWESGEESVAELCRRYGISRKTAYRWWARWREQGLEGLEERSRAPHRQPQRIAPAWERAVVEARGAHPTWGPKKLRVELEKLTAQLGEELPARGRWRGWRAPIRSCCIRSAIAARKRSGT